jgi:hypothetical protein
MSLKKEDVKMVDEVIGKMIKMKRQGKKGSERRNMVD